MTTIDLGEIVMHSGDMTTEDAPAPARHGWRGGAHRRPRNEGYRVLAKLSGALVLAVVGGLTTAGAATHTLAWFEVAGLASVLAVLGFLVVRR